MARKQPPPLKIEGAGELNRRSLFFITEEFSTILKKDKKGIAFILKMSIIMSRGINLKMRIINIKRSCFLREEV